MSSYVSFCVSPYNVTAFYKGYACGMFKRNFRHPKEEAR